MKNILLKPNEYDDEMLERCLEVQENFESFKSSVFATLCAEMQQRFLCTRTFNVGSLVVVFDLYNTAWLSTNPEIVGQLLGPPEDILKRREPIPEHALRVAVLHHPLHWIAPDSVRALRTAVEEEADIIFTGHEHVQSNYSRAEHGSAGSDYIEGGVLQESRMPEVSTFNLIEASLEERSFRVHHWSWTGSEYALVKSGDPQAFKRSRKGSHKRFRLTDSFFHNYLKNIGAQFSHPRKDSISFDDLYTAPDFRKFAAQMTLGKSRSQTISGTRAFAEMESASAIVISGNEKVGKTSALKYLYWKFYAAGFVPLLVSGDALKTIDHEAILSALKKAFRDQYDSAYKFENYKSLESSCRIVFFDDFHDSNLGIEGRTKVLRWFEKFFCKVIVIGDDALRVEQLSGDKRHRELFADYAHYQILEFGYLLREKLISRWILLAGEDYLEESDYSLELKQKAAVVSSILGKNVVPAYPLFVLVILQQMEAGLATRTATGSFGYFYESLITESLASVLNQKEIDTYYNLIAELAYRLYTASSRNIDRSELVGFITYYNREYKLNLNPATVEDKLVAARILFMRGREALRFQYKYVYYYFIARHAAHNLIEAERDALIDSSVKLIHTERAANIVVFLSYLSKSPKIIGALVVGAQKLYENTQACDFDLHVKQIAALQNEVPRFILPSGDPNQHREAALRLKDSSGPRTEESGALAHDDDDKPDFDDKVDDILTLNRAFKCMQVLGQIVRNFSGSLKAQPKYELANECVSLGLRSINYLFGILQDHLSDVILQVRNMLQEKSGDVANSELENRAKILIFFLCEAAASGVTRRIATDVGVPDLMLTYDDIVSDNPTVAYQMVKVAIKMDHKGDFPADDVISLAALVADNIFAKAVLCQLVAEHFYLFHVPEPVRQRVCSVLGIGVKEDKVHGPSHKRLGRELGGSR